MYRTAGHGPVVVLLHGIAGTSATWEDVIPSLAERYTVVAPDLLGHGGTCKPEGDYSLGAYANGVRDLIAALGHERATLVGHSLGGAVALQFAYQFPRSCERIVLVASGGLGREVHPVLRLACLPAAAIVLPWLSVAARDGVGRIAGLLGKLGLRASADLAEAWRGFVSLSDRDTRRAFLTTVRGAIDLHGQRYGANDLIYLAADLPTLIVWGEKDPLIPATHARAAHALLPHSRLAVFPRAGHFPHREAPRRFARTLLDFLETTRPLRPDATRFRRNLRQGPPGKAA